MRGRGEILVPTATIAVSNERVCADKVETKLGRSVPSPESDDHGLCGVPLAAGCCLKRGLCRPDDIRVLRGPFEKRSDRALERPAQFRKGIFDPQPSCRQHSSRDKAALFQTPQTLSEALLRKARNVAANGIESPPVVMIAQRSQDMDRPFVSKQIEQHAIITRPFFAGGHDSGYLKETRLKYGA